MKAHKVLIVAVASALVGSAPFSWEVRSVLFALLYLLLRRVVRQLAGTSDDLNNDVFAIS